MLDGNVRRCHRFERRRRSGSVAGGQREALTTGMAHPVFPRTPEGFRQVRCRGRITPGLPHGRKTTTMPSTHTSLDHHFVFSTKDRRPSIHPDVRARIHEYLGGCLRAEGAAPLMIGGVADHVHLLAGLRATHSVAALMRDLKRASCSWIHQELGLRDFAWQEGYGAFAVSRSQVPTVAKYIERQEEHHRVRTFGDEYRRLLEKHEVPFDERFLW